MLGHVHLVSFPGFRTRNLNLPFVLYLYYYYLLSSGIGAVFFLLNPELNQLILIRLFKSSTSQSHHITSQSFIYSTISKMSAVTKGKDGLWKLFMYIPVYYFYGL